MIHILAIRCTEDLDLKKYGYLINITVIIRLFLYDNGELGNLSLAGFNVHISRHYSKYLIVYYLPSGLFVLVSWTSFVIPPQVEFFCLLLSAV